MKYVVVALFIVLLVFVLVGCGTNGVTGNVVNEDAVDGRYAGSSDSPQKNAKMTGTGHERACY